MLKQIRRIQKGTLIVVTAIIVVAFTYYGQRSDPLGQQSCLIKVGNRCYRQKEVQKLVSHFAVARDLMMYDFAMPMLTGDDGQGDPLNFALNLIVLRKEAAKLGINPGIEEIKKEIPKLNIFMRPNVSADYLQNRILGPNGFTNADLSQLVKDYLSYKKLQELIGSGVQAVPSEVERAYIRKNQRIDSFAIHFDRKDYVEKVKVTSEEIKAYYEKNKAEIKQDGKNNLFSEEKRGFDYVKFTRDEIPKDATNEQISKSNLSFAKAVNSIYADLAEEDADFIAIAKRVQADIKATLGMTVELKKFAPFTADGAPESIKEDEGQVTGLFSGAVQKGAVTVPFEQKDGSYYIYKFSEQIEPEPLALKDATAAITTVLKNKKSNQLVNDAANAALAKLNDLLKAGKSIQAAAKETGVKLVKIPNFSEAEPPAETPDSGLIIEGADGLVAKSLSKVISKPNGRGFLLVYVDKIQIYKDENKNSAERSIIATKEMDAKRGLFTSWLKKKRKESGAIKNTETIPPNEAES